MDARAIAPPDPVIGIVGGSERERWFGSMTHFVRQKAAGAGRLGPG